MAGDENGTSSSGVTDELKARRAAVWRSGEESGRACVHLPKKIDKKERAGHVTGEVWNAVL
jgi:hypothetical protein